jgi:hypothetical protein
MGRLHALSVSFAHPGRLSTSVAGLLLQCNIDPRQPIGAQSKRRMYWQMTPAKRRAQWPAPP